MFALEIEFHDGVSSPETILVRRTQAIVGSSDVAHVVVEGTASAPCELRIIRGLEREFKCQPLRRSGQDNAVMPFTEGNYRGEAEIRLGDVTVRVTALDSDLCLSPEDYPDQAALRVLRRSLTKEAPKFPAVVVLGTNPVLYSFHADQPLVVGRSRKCGLRLEGASVSSEHARIGLDGDKFWVEDLGSTNGTLINGERVSGRKSLDSDESIKVGSEFTILPLRNEADVGKLDIWSGEGTPGESQQSYPCIVVLAEGAQPDRYIMGRKGLVRIGRDPANDIWITQNHVSRKHLEVEWSSPSNVTVTDFSSNGSYLDGNRLERGNPVLLKDGYGVVDLCSGAIIAVCSSAADEEKFRANPDVSAPEGEDINTKTEEESILPEIPATVGIGSSDGYVFNSHEGMNLHSSGASGRSAASEIEEETDWPSQKEVFWEGESASPGFSGGGGGRYNDAEPVAAKSSNVAGVRKLQEFYPEEEEVGEVLYAESEPEGFSSRLNASEGMGASRDVGFGAAAQGAAFGAALNEAPGATIGIGNYSDPRMSGLGAQRENSSMFEGGSPRFRGGIASSGLLASDQDEEDYDDEDYEEGYSFRRVFLYFIIGVSFVVVGFLALGMILE